MVVHTPVSFEGRSLGTSPIGRSARWRVLQDPKHASIAMFEGYSGSSPSGFRREIEQERALGQIDDVVEHYEEAIKRGLPPAGPAAARLRSEFARIRDELGDLPGRIVDAQRLRSMLGHLGRTLHVGLLADCFFDPDTALRLDRENATTDPERAGVVPLPPGSLPERLRHAPSSGALTGVDRRGRTLAPGIGGSHRSNTRS